MAMGLIHTLRAYDLLLGLVIHRLRLGCLADVSPASYR